MARGKQAAGGVICAAAAVALIPAATSTVHTPTYEWFYDKSMGSALVQSVPKAHSLTNCPWMTPTHAGATVRNLFHNPSPSTRFEPLRRALTDSFNTVRPADLSTDP